MNVARRNKTLAVVEPAEKAGTLSAVDEHLVSLIDPSSPAAEQFRVLRNAVERLARERQTYVLAVASPVPGDGKTLTAINLAGALAQSADRKVLLVEADLRAPTVALKLGCSSGQGLSAAVADAKLSLEQVLVPLPRFNLWMLPCGQTPRSPYETLRSPRFRELIDEARRRFDFVVVDAPPVVPFPDCRLIADCVDGFLVVVAAHQTPRGLVEEAIHAIDPAKLAGFVLNRADGLLSGYYGSMGRPVTTANRGSPG